MLGTEQKSLDSYKKQISVNLKYLLDIYSMNMLELSKKIEVSYGSVYDLVECTSNPTLTTLFKISEYFKLNISQLIGDLAFTNCNDDTFVKTVPIVEWNEIEKFLENFSLEKTNARKTVLISSKNQFTEKTFALLASTKTEPLFKSGTILIFNDIISDIKNYDNHFVLVKSYPDILGIKKIFIEEGKVFLQSINTNIPPQQLNDQSLIIAHMTQAKLDMNNS